MAFHVPKFVIIDPPFVETYAPLKPFVKQLFASVPCPTCAEKIVFVSIPNMTGCIRLAVAFVNPTSAAYVVFDNVITEFDTLLVRPASAT